ncbi:MAG: exopolysaccharide Pel transporter PelG [Myxococcales bacterium]|nr:exopolysaccharide Pel transporter PelG [Myxococcales bacterium]
MAGIGFELRTLLRSQSLFGMLRAYSFAGAISSGPWMLTISCVLAIGILGRDASDATQQMERFQVTVTYIIATTLILTGGLQLGLSRFIADRLFERQPQRVLPNLLGAITLTSAVSGLLGTTLSWTLFEEPLAYRVLLVSNFVTMSNIWIVVVVLSSLKAYRQVLISFLIGSVLVVGSALSLRHFGVSGLLLGFLLGHAVLMFLLLALIMRRYPGHGLVAFQFLRRGQLYPSLILTGLLYNLAIWADKFLFWTNPATSEAVLGPLRASLIYDIPIFLSYLSIVPGMSVFLVRIETDFVECYDAFYDAVRNGDTLSNLQRLKDRMVYVVRQGIYEIFKVQGLTVIVLIICGRYLLAALGISAGYLALFYVDLVAAGLQVLLLAVLNIFFYLDQRRVTLLLSATFLLSNFVFTAITQQLGPAFYGYGFASAMLLTCLLGIWLLSARLDSLEYETFMMQRFA